MLRIVRLVVVVGIGMAGAACQDDGQGAPRGVYQPANNNNNNNNNYNPAPNYNANQQRNYNQGNYGQRNQGTYNQTDGRRYTTVTVTNRGQNGYRDDVVQQQVVCGSQYYDGYRTRTAPRC
jgi:hypothetical protein